MVSGARLDRCSSFSFLPPHLGQALHASPCGSPITGMRLLGELFQKCAPYAQAQGAVELVRRQISHLMEVVVAREADSLQFSEFKFLLINAPPHLSHPGLRVKLTSLIQRLRQERNGVISQREWVGIIELKIEAINASFATMLHSIDSTHPLYRFIQWLDDQKQMVHERLSSCTLRTIFNEIQTRFIEVSKQEKTFCLELKAKILAEKKWLTFLERVGSLGEPPPCSIGESLQGLLERVESSGADICVVSELAQEQEHIRAYTASLLQRIRDRMQWQVLDEATAFAVREAIDTLIRQIYEKGSPQTQNWDWGQLKCRLNESIDSMEIVLKKAHRQGSWKKYEQFFYLMGPEPEAPVSAYAKMRKWYEVAQEWDRSFTQTFLQEEFEKEKQIWGRLLEAQVRFIPRMRPIYRRKVPKQLKALRVEWCSKGSLEDQIRLYVDCEPAGAALVEEREAFLRRRGCVAYEVAEALRGIHAAGVVHLDLKATNIVSAQDYSSRVTDFGLSLEVGTQWFGGMPTRPYTPIEQFSELWNADPAMDMWAFGLFLRELKSGVLSNVFFQRCAELGYCDAYFLSAEFFPYMRTLWQGARDEMAALSDGSALDEFINRLLDIDPQKRPSASDAVAFFSEYEEVDLFGGETSP